MSNSCRTGFAVVVSVIGLLCIGYAFILIQIELSSGRQLEGILAVAAMIAFGLSGGLCVLAGAVVLNGPQSRDPGPRS